MDDKKIISLISTYQKTWETLFHYDENTLHIPDEEKNVCPVFDYDQAREVIQILKQELRQAGQVSNLFGLERNNDLHGILGNLHQSFGGAPVYASSAQRAAHLLYFVIKDHPFSDGNKRIGCLLFLLYLKKAGLQLATINDNGLIALALLVAESPSGHKESIVKLIASMLGQD